MQARWGSHGDYEIIALSPSSPQESFDLTVDAFNLADTYRVPVMILSDEIVGHMNEKVVIPEPEEIKIVARKKPEQGPGDFAPFFPDDDGIPPMVHAGEGYHIHATGLTHDEHGYPLINSEAQERLVQRLVNKIRKNSEKIVHTEEYYLDDAEVIIVSYGCSARTAFDVVETARAKGIKAGLLRLVTIWPFAEKKVKSLAARKNVRAFVVAEINHGQIVYEVERCVEGKAETVLAGLMGGRIFEPGELFEVVREAAG